MTLPMALDAQARADTIRFDGHEQRRRHHARRVARLRSRVSEPGLERRRTTFRPGGRDRRAAQRRISKRPTTCRTGTSATSAGRRPASTTSITTAIAESAANEWHFDVETFRRVDRNRDGALDQTEFLGGEVDDVRDASFDDLDWNNNGRVERSEWSGSPAVFTSLDRNRDGVLSRFEVVGGIDTPNDTWDRVRVARLQPQRIASARDEWHWSAVSFNRRDYEPRRHALASGIRGRAAASAGRGRDVGCSAAHRAREFSAAVDRHRASSYALATR